MVWCGAMLPLMHRHCHCDKMGTHPGIQYMNMIRRKHHLLIPSQVSQSEICWNIWPKIAPIDIRQWESSCCMGEEDSHRILKASCPQHIFFFLGIVLDVQNARGIGVLNRE